MSCTFSHPQNTFNHSCVYSCVGGGSVLISELTDWPGSSYLTDEMFQKVAEDYNTSAFQYMTGQCSPESDVRCFKRETPHIKHLLCLGRGTRRGPWPEEGLIFLLLLPQQLMLSNRKWKRWPLPGRDLNVDMSNMSALEYNKDRAALIKFIYFFFLLCHKDLRAWRLYTRGSDSAATRWKGIFFLLPPLSWTKQKTKS